MVLTSPEIENLVIPLPITQENRQIAQQFAICQPTREKAEQVWLNTLAVLVVDNYFTMLGISTNLASSDSWNPVMQIANNVADLDVLGVGKLECRPIKSSVSSCQIPPEVREFRFGYVVVQIDDSYKKAAIIGFTSQVTTEELAINTLKSPEVLIDRIHELKESSVTDLGQWLNNVFEVGWQRAENLLNPEQLTPAFGFRRIESKITNISESGLENNRVSRAKLINLGIHLGDNQVILLVEIDSEENDKIAVTLQVHPVCPQIYLPEELGLKVKERADVVFMQAQARSKDNYIQLQFSGQTEEAFTIEIIIDSIKFSENFKL